MKIHKYQYGNPIEEWGSQWKDRLQPQARSKVLQKWNASEKRPKPESSNEYTKRRVKEETKRTWRSNAADILHGIGEGTLALHPYTAIPYFGAKVGQDFLNGTYGWHTALNASVPLFHLAPQAVGLREATNVALEDAANAGSKTARNWRVAREINQVTRNKPNLSNRTISVKRSNNEITGQPDLVYTLYNEFGEPIGQTNIGGAVFGSGNKTHRMVDGVMSMRNAHKVSEDTYNAAVQDIIDNGGKGLESGWSLMMPQKTLAVTSKFPHTVIGQEFGNPVRLLTGTSKRSIPQKVQGNHYLEQNPSFEIKYNESTGNFEQIPIANSEPYVSTSLKFFERKPAKSVTREYVQSPKNITSDVGNLIAEGSERSTYTSKSNPNIVYKIEDAPLDNIKNIKIRKEVADDIIAPETTVGYYNRNGKYYRVTQQDKYKSWNPDDFDINYSPELDQEIIDALRKAKWNVELGTYNGAPYARTASKNGIKIGNLEYFNWGRDPHGNLKLIDQQVYSQKQGGKMNTLQFLKNGSGIHIKKKNRGKINM